MILVASTAKQLYHVCQPAMDVNMLHLVFLRTQTYLLSDMSTCFDDHMHLIDTASENISSSQADAAAMRLWGHAGFGNHNTPILKLQASWQCWIDIAQTLWGAVVETNKCLKAWRCKIWIETQCASSSALITLQKHNNLCPMSNVSRTLQCTSVAHALL